MSDCTKCMTFAKSVHVPGSMHCRGSANSNSLQNKNTQIYFYFLKTMISCLIYIYFFQHWWDLAIAWGTCQVFVGSVMWLLDLAIVGGNCLLFAVSILGRWIIGRFPDCILAYDIWIIIIKIIIIKIYFYITLTPWKQAQNVLQMWLALFRHRLHSKVNINSLKTYITTYRNYKTYCSYISKLNMTNGLVKNVHMSTQINIDEISE